MAINIFADASVLAKGKRQQLSLLSKGKKKQCIRDATSLPKPADEKIVMVINIHQGRIDCVMVQSISSASAKGLPDEPSSS